MKDQNMNGNLLNGHNDCNCSSIVLNQESALDYQKVCQTQGQSKSERDCDEQDMIKRLSQFQVNGADPSSHTTEDTDAVQTVHTRTSTDYKNETQHPGGTESRVCGSETCRPKIRLIERHGENQACANGTACCCSAFTQTAEEQITHDCDDVLTEGCTAGAFHSNETMMSGASFHNHEANRQSLNAALHKERRALVRYMDPDKVVEQMVLDGKYDQTQLRDIRESATVTIRIRNILEFIRQRGPDAYRYFKQVLGKTDQKQLVKLLDMSERNENTSLLHAVLEEEEKQARQPGNKFIQEWLERSAFKEKEIADILNSVYNFASKKACRALIKYKIQKLRPPEEDPELWTIDKFLERHREHLCKTLPCQSLETLFPEDAKTRNFELWNVELQCKVILETCKPKPALRKCVQWVLSQNGTITKCNDNIEKTLDELMSYITTLAEESSNEEVQRELLKFFEYTKAKILPKELDYYCKSVCSEIARKITEGLRPLEKGQERIIGLLEDILKRLVNSPTQTSLPEIPIYTTLKNCDRKHEEDVYKQLKHAFEESHDDSVEILRGPVDEFRKSFQAQGRHIKRVGTGCIILYVQCSSLEALFKMLKDYMTGKLDSSFNNIEAAMQQLTGIPDLRLETSIDEEGFFRVLSSLDIERLCLQDKTDTPATKSSSQNKPRENDKTPYTDTVRAKDTLYRKTTKNESTSCTINAETDDNSHFETSEYEMSLHTTETTVHGTENSHIDNKYSPYIKKSDYGDASEADYDEQGDTTHSENNGNPPEMQFFSESPRKAHSNRGTVQEATEQNTQRRIAWNIGTVEDEDTEHTLSSLTHDNVDLRQKSRLQEPTEIILFPRAARMRATYELQNATNNTKQRSSGRYMDKAMVRSIVHGGKNLTQLCDKTGSANTFDDEEKWRKASCGMHASRKSSQALKSDKVESTLKHQLI